MIYASSLEEAIRPLLSSNSDLATFSIVEAPDDALFVSLRDRRVPVTKSQLEYTARTDTWPILAAGTIRRLRTQFPITGTPTFTYDEVLYEVRTALLSILHEALDPDTCRDLLADCLNEVEALKENARPVALNRKLAATIVSLIESPKENLVV